MHDKQQQQQERQDLFEQAREASLRAECAESASSRSPSTLRRVDTSCKASRQPMAPTTSMLDGRRRDCSVISNVPLPNATWRRRRLRVRV